MLPKSASAWFRFWTVVIVWSILSVAYAQGSPPTPITPIPISAQTMLENIADAVPNLMRLITAIAYVMGIYIIISGVILLKHVGEMRTQMSHEHHISKPLIMIVCGAMLTYLPTAVQVTTSTFWKDPSPIAYQPSSDQYFQFINICFIIVQFVGALAFIRGLIILSHAGAGGGQDSFKKGVVHIVGGILAINIYQFVQVIMITLGMNPI